MVGEYKGYETKLRYISFNKEETPKNGRNEYNWNETVIGTRVTVDMLINKIARKLPHFQATIFRKYLKIS